MARRRRHRRHHRRHNPLAVRAVNPISHGEELLLTGVILAAAAGGVYWWLNRYTFTITPGSQTIKVPAGQQFKLVLPTPSIGSWLTLASGAPNAMPSASQLSGNSPILLTASQGELINVTWQNSPGLTQNTTITIASP